MTEEEIRAAVLDTLLTHTNAKFWQRLQHWLEWAYGDGFQAVANDPRVLPEQQSAKLLDERFYLAERALQRAASETGLTASAQKITINTWSYTLVRGGAMCLVQSYVQVPSDMARPARFREQHAAVNTFLRSPELPLGDVPAPVFEVAHVNGILIHGPAGKDFKEDDQKLGFANFAVPNDTYSRWGLNFPLPEIAAAFEAHRPASDEAQRDIAKPRFKTRQKNTEKKKG